MMARLAQILIVLFMLPHSWETGTSLAQLLVTDMGGGLTNFYVREP
jgi:hypothetical protein